MSKNLTTRAEDYSKWYNELVVKADLAENSGVRGCMVIKPYGYAIWENHLIQFLIPFKDNSFGAVEILFSNHLIVGVSILNSFFN